MKTDIKTLLEFAGVDTSKGKAKDLVEMHADDNRVTFTVEVIDPQEGEATDLYLSADAQFSADAPGMGSSAGGGYTEVEDFKVEKPFLLNGQQFKVGDHFDPMDFQGRIDPAFEKDPEDFIMNQIGGGHEQWQQKAETRQAQHDDYQDSRAEERRYEDR